MTPTRGRALLVATGLLVLAACTPSPARPEQSGSAALLAGCRRLAPTVSAHPDAASAARVTSTLSTFADLGWNPDAPPVRPSTLTGGLFVNYRPSWDGRNDPAANTNIKTIGNSDADSGDAPRHDPLTDLVILRNVDALLSTGVVNAGLDQLRCRLQPVVEAEFVSYGVERGWVYGELVDLSQLDPDGPWSVHARTFAALLARKFGNGIDPTTDFRPDWIAQSAAALTDSGQRFGEPKWTEIGHQLALSLVRSSANPTTGFFPAQARLGSAGSAIVIDPLVKVGSQAQLVDALLHVYDDTQDEEVLDAARKSIASFQSPEIGIADSVNGGWFYAIDVDGTGVRQSYKETRQAWLVGLFRHAAENGLIPPEVSESLITIVREKMYQPDSRGYVYRVRDDWTTYVTTRDGQRIEENWVSSEATGIAVHALLGPLK